jgi:hypothetical protein
MKGKIESFSCIIYSELFVPVLGISPKYKNYESRNKAYKLVFPL